MRTPGCSFAEAFPALLSPDGSIVLVGEEPERARRRPDRRTPEGG